MRGRTAWITSVGGLLIVMLAAPLSCLSQEPAAPTAPAVPPTAATPDSPKTSAPVLPTPIAVVKTDGLKLSGAVDLGEGKAVIAFGGSVTAGEKASTIALPHRGDLRLCPMTKVNLTADSTVAASLRPGEAPGLMMALDQGALEANFQTGENSDVILTPDFRIVISAPGTAEVQVRLGDKGDTCVDNRSCPFDGAQNGLRFVEALLVFGFGNGVGDDAGAGLDVALTVLRDHGADGDAGVEVAGEVGVEDAPP
jgi:hypothetical protein